MLGSGVSPIPNFTDVGVQGIPDICIQIPEPFQKPGSETGVEPEGVIKHQDLAITFGAGADADGRNSQATGDFPSQLSRHQLQDDSKTPRLLKTLGLGPQTFCRSFFPALHPVPSKGVNRLWDQAKVAHDGDPGLNKRLHRLAGGRSSTLQFHSLDTGFFQHPTGISESVFRRNLEGEEWHIQDQEGLRRPPSNGLPVVNHLVQRNRDGVRVAQYHLTQGVANKEEVDPSFLHQPAEKSVVGRHRHDLLSLPLHFQKSWDRTSRPPGFGFGGQRMLPLVDPKCCREPSWRGWGPKVMDPGEGCQTYLPLPYPTSPPLVLPPTFRPMPMIWDAPLTAAVAKELTARLGGARLRGHSFHWNNRELTLYFGSETLRWSLHPRAGWVTLLPPVDPPERSRPLSADLVRVEARSDERFLRFLFRKVRGRSRSVQVIVELMTNQWNALLVEGQEEWIRHLLWTRRSESRTLAVGHAYQAPAPPTRRGMERALTREEWKEVILSHDEGEARRAVLETVAFTSPLNLPALFCVEGDGEIPGTGGEAGYPLWLRLRSLDPLRPCLLETARGNQPYPVLLKGFSYEEFPTILGAIQAASEERPEKDGSSERVMERIDRALQRARGRVGAIEREMTHATDPGECRERANLLLARLGEVRKGEAQATLKGFHGEEVILSLDPSRSPQENAEALYQEAARQERALNRLPPLLKRAEALVDELSQLKARLLASEISPEAAETQLPADPGRMKRNGTEEDLRLPYRRFRSSGGLEIRVGRGSGDNDALTFQHARPNDIWLHAREASGAHVVLRWTNLEAPPARDLAEAAVLAALHSRARNASVVPVDWTRRKYIRKPRKAPPGTVIPDRTKTLFVQPDPALPDRLIWED